MNKYHSNINEKKIMFIFKINLCNKNNLFVMTSAIVIM